MFRSQKSGAATHARVANQQIRGQLAAHGAAFVRDDRAHRRINRAPAHGPAGVDEVGRERVLDPELVVHGAHGGHVLGEAGGLREMLRVTHARHGGVDQVVIRARERRRRLGVAAFFRIEGIDLRHPAAEPNKNAVLRFSARRGDDGARRSRGGRRGGSERAGERGGGGGEGGGLGEEGATIHGVRAKTAGVFNHG